MSKISKRLLCGLVEHFLVTLDNRQLVVKNYEHLFYTVYSFNLDTRRLPRKRSFWTPSTWKQQAHKDWRHGCLRVPVLHAMQYCILDWWWLFEFKFYIIAAGIESRWKLSTPAHVMIALPVRPLAPSKLGRTPIMATTLKPTASVGTSTAYLPLTEGYTLSARGSRFVA